jgi:hypothetical protein
MMSHWALQAAGEAPDDFPTSPKRSPHTFTFALLLAWQLTIHCARIPALRALLPLLQDG